MKKSVKVLIIVGAAVLALLVGVGLFFGGLLDFHYTTLETAKEGLESEQVWLENQALRVETDSTEVEIMGDDTITYVIFKVYDKKTDELLFESEPICRIWDFKDIYFKENTNDIIIRSGDVGPIFYSQISENHWQKMPYGDD